MALIAEPTSETIATESLGFMHMQLVAKRKSQHMGTAKRENSALYDMIDVITEFDKTIQGALTSIGKKKARGLIHNFGIIKGGQDAAIPIGEIHSEATIFYPADISKLGLEKALELELKRAHPDYIDLRFSDFGFRGHASPDNPLNTALIDTRIADNIQPGTFKSPCDARIFSSYGVDNVTVYGPGRLEDAHSVDEQIRIKLPSELQSTFDSCISPSFEEVTYGHEVSAITYTRQSASVP